MELYVAKNAGFCFGVKNAVEKALELADKGGKVYTYGPIIHNEAVVQDLKEKGISIVEDLNAVNEGDTVVIRSHGISKDEYKMLEDKNANIVDATCQNVKNIHKIVEEKCSEGYKIVIIGDGSHPEVEGINGWCKGNAVIISSEDDLNKISDNLPKICVVTQTTFKKAKWLSLTSKILDKANELLIFNTICSATQLRQKEAEELSGQVDLMLVIGGKNSSNTAKLFEICSNNCRTILIEDEKEIDVNQFNGVNKAGIAAGASTPDYIINNVIEKIKHINSDDKEVVKMEEMDKSANNVKTDKETIKETVQETMEDMYSFYDDIYPGSIVEGKVIHVSEKEVFVDIGYKADGILPVEEASFETINLCEKFKPEDKVTVEVLKLNDGEGNVVLSRKAVEKEEFVNSIKRYKDEGKSIDITVTALNKGGFNCQYGEIRAFMPLSLSGVGRDENPEILLGKKLKAQISDIKEKYNEIELVVSRKEILNEEKQERITKFIEKVQCGEVYKGKVKSIIKVGAFITVEDVDVFVPISEIAWKRIESPSDVIKENQSIDVLIIKVDSEQRKVTGSIKRTGKEPWEKFVTSYKENDIIEGKVVRFTDFGAFVELIDGVDGLLHISNISEKHINKPQDALKLGQIIKTKIIKIDQESKRVSLSLKDIE